MARLLSYVIQAALLVALVVWLAENPGSVSLDWLGWHIDTSFAVLAGGLALLLLGLFLLVRLGGRILRGPRNLRRNREARRQRDGYRALTQGLSALAAGEADEARRQANRASRLLGQPPLATLLGAQAAQLDGDEGAARKQFGAMLADPETEFLGLRGLATLEIKAGNFAAARGYAERALLLRPAAPALLAILAELHARGGDWHLVSGTLDRAARAKALRGPELAHKRAVAALGEARAAQTAGNLEEALAAADRALKARPEFVPAMVAKARLSIATGRTAKASQLIERAWRTSPHRDLAALYATELDPLARVKRFERLVAAAPAEPESHLAIGDAALAARLWGEARRHYARAAELSPAAQARAYRSLAEIEKLEHQDFAKAESWHVKALAAPAEPGWRCSACDAPSLDWQPRCAACGAVDSIAWRAAVLAVLPADAAE